MVGSKALSPGDRIPDFKEKGWDSPLSALVSSPSQGMLRIDVTEPVSTATCGQKVLEGVLTCSPGFYEEGFRIVKNSRAGFH